MKKYFFIGLIVVYVSLFVMYCRSGQSCEVVENGKDTVAVVADSQIVSLPCPRKETVDVDADADSLASFEVVRGIEGMIAKKLCCLRFVEFTYQGGSKKLHFAGFLGEKSISAEVRDTTLSLDNGFKIAIKNRVLKLYFDDNLCCTRNLNEDLKTNLARITR